jgi:hypothetical protein
MKTNTPPKTKPDTKKTVEEIVLEDSSLTATARIILENTLKFDFSKNK